MLVPVRIHSRREVDTPRVGHAVHEGFPIQRDALFRQSPKQDVDDGLHVGGAGVEGLQEGAKDGAEDKDDAGCGEEGAVSCDVLEDVLGEGVAPAVDDDGGWVGGVYGGCGWRLDVDLVGEGGEAIKGVDALKGGRCSGHGGGCGSDSGRRGR